MSDDEKKKSTGLNLANAADAYAIALKNVAAAEQERGDRYERELREALHVSMKARLYSHRVLQKLKHAVDVGLAHVKGQQNAEAMAQFIEEAGLAASRIDEVLRTGVCGCVPGSGCEFAVAKVPLELLRKPVMVVRPSKAAPHLGVVESEGPTGGAA